MTADPSDPVPAEGILVRSPVRRKRWLVLVGSVSLTILAAEVGLRIAGYGRDREPSFQCFFGRGIRLICLSRNPTGYLDVDLTDPRVRKRLHDEYGIIDMEKTYQYTPYGVVTPADEHGMRPGQMRPKAPGRIRVIAVGDSFTYGQGLKPGDPWPRQLETLLNAQAAGRFEVLNCGVMAKDIDWIASLLIHRLLPLQPDVVIYAWYLNDGIRSKEFNDTRLAKTRKAHAQATYVPDHCISDGGERVMGLRRWSAVYDLAWSKLNSMEVGRAFVAWGNEMYGPDNKEGWGETQQLLYRMAEVSRLGGAAFHVVLWPVLTDLGSSYPFGPAHHAIAEACEKDGIPLLDLRETLRSHPADGLKFHPDDEHPSKLACRIAAEAIRDDLMHHHPELFRQGGE
ncbi:MAG: SGNH/GDSL hydrolase family protein [Phycisphaerae bacterium]|nr:SGNH/GDSL hydrolase family protein [Phycisphaerae bacterium]